MSQSKASARDAYCWKKPQGRTKLAPLRSRIYTLLEKSPGQTLGMDEIYKKLKPTANTTAKKTAVRMAVSDLSDLGLIATAGPTARRGPVASPEGALAAEAKVTWACPAGTSQVFEYRILRFLQTAAESILAASPARSVATIAFSLDEIRHGVEGKNPVIEPAIYTTALTVTLKGCVRLRGDGKYQAVTA
jgi:hypothetical protein